MLLFFCSIYQAYTVSSFSHPLGNVLTTLVSQDKEEHQNISVLLTFCRHCGEDYMGLVPRRIRNLAETFKVNP